MKTTFFKSQKTTPKHLKHLWWEFQPPKSPLEYTHACVLSLIQFEVMSSFVSVVLSVNWRSCRLLYRSLEFFDLNFSVREFHFWHFSLLSFLSHGQKLCHIRTRHCSHIFRHEERTCPDKIRRRTWLSSRSDNDDVGHFEPKLLCRNGYST